MQLKTTPKGGAWLRTLLLLLCLGLAACGNKEGKNDAAKSDTKAEAADKPAGKAKAKPAADSPKYQEAVQKLNPAFKKLKLPIELSPMAGETYAEVSKDLLAKHLGLKDINGLSINAIGRYDDPNGETRYVLAYTAPVTVQFALYAFDAETEKWVEQEIGLLDSGGEASSYGESELLANGDVKYTTWVTEMSSPGDISTEEVKGQKKTEVLRFEGGKWVVAK